MCCLLCVLLATVSPSLFRGRKNRDPSLNLVLVRGCSGGVLVVHLGSVVVRLGVGVETQLVVFPREHPQEVGVIAEPGRTEDGDWTGGGGYGARSTVKI